MMIIKGILLLLLCVSAMGIGVLIASSYKKRVKELKEVKKALSLFETKLKFTYEPIPEIFSQISSSLSNTIGAMFGLASKKMREENAQIAWEEALEETKNTHLKQEDIEVIKGLGKLLGKTDMEGQVSEIQLTNTFLETQIQKAEEECQKNEKLYKTLGTVTGLGLVILLI